MEVHITDGSTILLEVHLPKHSYRTVYYVV